MRIGGAVLIKKVLTTKIIFVIMIFNTHDSNALIEIQPHKSYFREPLLWCKAVYVYADYHS